MPLHEQEATRVLLGATLCPKMNSILSVLGGMRNPLDDPAQNDFKADPPAVLGNVKSLMEQNV